VLTGYFDVGVHPGPIGLKLLSSLVGGVRPAPQAYTSRSLQYDALGHLRQEGGPFVVCVGRCSFAYLSVHSVPSEHAKGLLRLPLPGICCLRSHACTHHHFTVFGYQD
jgi:hypothetical protein